MEEGNVEKPLNLSVRKFKEAEFSPDETKF